MIDIKYSKDYRNRLGFSNQGGVKSFFAAKDIIPTVDFGYIELLNNRLFEIVDKINNLVVPEIRVPDPGIFCRENISVVFETLRENNILPRLNNQGRRSEEVYFSFMRGYVISAYFTNALSHIFETPAENIVVIGDDDFEKIETFKRTAKADIEIRRSDGTRIRIEVQSGFQGINDIKQHKVLEAKRINREMNIPSVVVHFDLHNGQVAFVRIDGIEDDDVNWITRQQMEGQTVFNIDQNYFVWKLTELPPRYSDLSF